MCERREGSNLWLSFQRTPLWKKKKTCSCWTATCCMHVAGKYDSMRYITFWLRIFVPKSPPASAAPNYLLGIKHLHNCTLMEFGWPDAVRGWTWCICLHSRREHTAVASCHRAVNPVVIKKYLLDRSPKFKVGYCACKDHGSNEGDQFTPC